MKVSKARKFLESKITERTYIKKELTELKLEGMRLEKRIKAKEKAYLFIEEVALSTQQQLEFHLNEMVSNGLNSVFDQHYEFDTHFEVKRGRPECQMKFKKNDHLVDPLEFSGLGAADVAAFGLRGASISMANRYRKVLLLDEPFKYLKGEQENKRVILLMRKVSKQLGIQIICVNDERAARDDIVAGADRVFHVTQTNGKSQVKIL